MKELQEVLEPTIIDIWASLLGLDVMPLPEAPSAPDTGAYVGCVHLTAELPGTIVLQCDEPLARLIAARMFEVAAEEASDADIRDAVGELTNVAAGNLKAALPVPSVLSLPTVIHGTDFRTYLPNSHLVARSRFACGSDYFSVSVFERSVRQAP